MKIGLEGNFEENGICPFVAFQQLIPKTSEGRANIVKPNTPQAVEVEPALIFNACLGKYCKLYDRTNDTCVFVSILKKDA